MLARGSKSGSAEGSMPSTRGNGSKMMWFCSLGLFGGVSLQPLFAERAVRTVLGPAHRGIVNRVAFVGQLYGYAKPDRSPCYSLSDFVEEEARTARGGFGLAEIFVAGDRQHPVAPVAAHALRVGKLEGGDREKRLPGIARRNGFRNLDKPNRRWMGGKELPDGIRVRPGRVGGAHRIQELHESFRGARREAVDRVTDDVGMDM